MLSGKQGLTHLMSLLRCLSALLCIERQDLKSSLHLYRQSVATENLLANQSMKVFFLNIQGQMLKATVKFKKCPGASSDWILEDCFWNCASLRKKPQFWIYVKYWNWKKCKVKMAFLAFQRILLHTVYLWKEGNNDYLEQWDEQTVSWCLHA